MKGGYPLRIDFHTHVFPDKLAEKALTSISEHTGAPYFTNGTVADTDGTWIVLLHYILRPTPNNSTM